MANVVRKGEGKYLIRVSRGSGKDRQFINKTFRGTLADARRHAREIESAVDSDDLNDFKVKLLASLSDPVVSEAVSNALATTLKRDASLGRGILRAVK